MNPGAEPQSRGWYGRQGASGTGSSAKLAWRKVGQAEVSRQGKKTALRLLPDPGFTYEPLNASQVASRRTNE